MTIGLLYWILMLLWLVFGLWLNWPGRAAPFPYAPFGNTLLLFVLLVILGWAQFGPPVK